MILSLEVLGIRVNLNSLEATVLEADKRFTQYISSVTNGKARYTSSPKSEVGLARLSNIA